MPVSILGAKDKKQLVLQNKEIYSFVWKWILQLTPLFLTQQAFCWQSIQNEITVFDLNKLD